MNVCIAVLDHVKFFKCIFSIFHSFHLLVKSKKRVSGYMRDIQKQTKTAGKTSNIRGKQRNNRTLKCNKKQTTMQETNY